MTRRNSHPASSLLHCLEQLEGRGASDHAALVTVGHHLLCIDRTKPAADSEVDGDPIIADESPSGLVCRQVVDDLSFAQVQRCVFGWPRTESCADLIDLDDRSDTVASDLDRSAEPVRTCYSEATCLTLDRLSPVGPAVELLPEEIAATYDVVADKGAGINDYVVCGEAHSIGTSWSPSAGVTLASAGGSRGGDSSSSRVSASICMNVAIGRMLIWPLT